MAELNRDKLTHMASIVEENANLDRAISKLSNVSPRHQADGDDEDVTSAPKQITNYFAYFFGYSQTVAYMNSLPLILVTWVLFQVRF